MNDLGVAGYIRVKQFCGEDAIDGAVNMWLRNNPDVEVIDIKFSTSATEGAYASDILVIYRNEE